MLDFSGEERGRTGLEGGEGGWLGGLLGARSRRTSSSQVKDPPESLHLFTLIIDIITGPTRAEHSQGIHSVP